MQEILVLAAHPDDESLGCGGTIAQLARNGAAVDVVYLTRGELGVDAPEAATPESRQRLAARRSEEAAAACATLGVRDIIHLDGRDGEIARHPELAERLRSLLSARGYQRVFCPWWNDGHPDHQATFRWFQQAATSVANPPQAWLYEIWTPMEPTALVPIDGTIEIRRAAVREHVSQLSVLDYLTAFDGLAAYRALRCPPSRYVEAFRVCSAEELTALRVVQRS